MAVHEDISEHSSMKGQEVCEPLPQSEEVWAVDDLSGRESQFSLSVWLATVHWRPHNQKYKDSTNWNQWVINVCMKEDNEFGKNREMQDMAVNRINVHHNKFPKS